MPFIKCPNCGNKISIPPTPAACLNCGEPISAPGSRTSASSAPMPPVTGPMPRSASSYPPVPVSKPMPPVPVPSSSYPPVPVSGPTAPIPVSSPTPPVPVPSAPVAVSVFGPLPRNMPSRSPDFEGTVSIPPTTHEVKLGTDWSHAVLGCLLFPFLLIFKPMMLVMGLVGLSSRPERKMTITTIRLQRPDGVVRNARLEGDLMGAGVSLGDTVSLWGSDRSGTVIVKRAYNHTTSSEISVRPPFAPWIARVFAGMILLILGFIILSILLSVH